MVLTNEQLEERVIALEQLVGQLRSGGQTLKGRVDDMEPEVAENRQRVEATEEEHAGLKEKLTRRVDHLRQWRDQVRRQFHLLTKRVSKVERRLP